MNYNNAVFEKAFATAEQLEESDLPEICFCGRSNVGKSSLINAVLGRKSIARVSSKPGKTVTVNFYRADNVRLVDLPGYGYAKVSVQEKERWGELIEAYFASGTIAHGVLIVDIRHKPTADDVVMANWFLQAGVAFTVVANKLDKIKKSELVSSINTIKTTLHLPEHVEVIPFSAEKGDGRQALWGAILPACEN